jgi:hypothetical protein
MRKKAPTSGKKPEQGEEEEGQPSKAINTAS